MDMNELWRPSAGVRKRSSTWDRTGGNADNVVLDPGERVTLLDVRGASGTIRRMWFTLSSDDPAYLRTTTLDFTFDDIPCTQSIPFGMLTATGPWRVNDVVSAATNVMRSRGGNCDEEGTGRGSFNLHWTMPFTRSACVELVNGSAEPLRLFYHIEYVEEPVAPDALLFHADHRVEDPTTPAVVIETPLIPEAETAPAEKTESRNTTDVNNYLFTEIDGHVGNYVGTVLAVESHPDREGKWYEGDEMFVIDGEQWPPSVHGTGTEDYFGMAWGVHRPYQAFDHGVTHYERDITDHDRFFDGRFTLYRWHLADPVGFRTSLRASIESGHANDCRQHYESLALWYGRPLHS